MVQAKIVDEQLAKVLNSDLDSLLIFVSHLFFMLGHEYVDGSIGGSVLSHPLGFLDRGSQGASRRFASKNKRLNIHSDSNSAKSRSSSHF
jgi:hypothetical protein